MGFLTNRSLEAGKVRVGEHSFSESDDINKNRKTYDIDEFMRHRDYNVITLLHDIALVRIKGSITFGLYVRPACLHQYKTQILMNQTAVAVGYGSMGYGEDSSTVLMKVNLTVVHPRGCRNILESSKSQICVQGSNTSTGEYGDTCQGKRFLKKIYFTKKFN